jgi:gamma-glutamyltranspeptidase / glutathione hydrolase
MRPMRPWPLAWRGTVAEPLLCSLGGGGLGLVQRRGQAPLALDCFTQTPRHKRVDPLDFYPIIGNFGTDTQEFHVGMASIATPGVIAGLVRLNERFGRCRWAKWSNRQSSWPSKGVPLNGVQRYTLEILEPIVRCSDATVPGLFGLS